MPRTVARAALRSAVAALVLVAAAGVKPTPASGSTPASALSSTEWPCPDFPVDRAAMAYLIACVLAGGDENVPDFSGTPTFPDVPEGSWALKYVEYAVGQNVVAGYGDGTYHPEYEVTRDQMAAYVARSICDPTGEDGLADYTPADPRNFPDVPEDSWGYLHVEYCVENAVVAGYLDGLYHPEVVVTRDQMAVYIARAFGLLD